MTFGVTEVALFAVLSVLLVILAGSDNTLSVFGTSLANAPGYEGLAGVIAGTAYCILAYSGFEGAAPLAEEAAEPRKTIPRAVVLSLLCVGLIEVFCVYAATVAYGPENATEFSGISGSIGQGWKDLADTVLPLGAVLVVITVAISCLANANAGSNAATRTLFAFGRIRILPRRLSTVDATRHSPTTAIVAQTVITTIVTLGLGFAFGPVEAYGIIGTGITLAFVLLYMSVHVSCCLFYLRRRREEFGIVRHGVVPIAGLALLVPALFVVLGIQVFDFITPISAPFSYGAIAVWIWIAIGVVYAIFTKLRSPEKVKHTSSVLEESV